MWEFNELQFYKKSECTLPCGIKITAPTLGEIADYYEEYGEENYLSMISLLTAEPFDLPYQLSQVGIDFTEIDSFTLFCYLTHSLTPKDTKLLFGDLDFSKFIVVSREDKPILMNKQGIVIDETVREQLTACLRKMHHIPKQQFNKVGNDFAKNMYIETARKDMERAKRKRLLKGKQSTYLPLISSLIAHEGFNYTWDNVWDIHIHQFFDSIQRMQIRDNAKNLYTGLYSGTIEYAKIKKDLEWLRPLKV